MSRNAFFTFCRENPDLRIERNASGQIEIMPPTSSETGRLNASLSGELYVWNRALKAGVTFDSSTGFTLPNGAERSPDAAWISIARWEALPESEKRRFANIVPDFVVELRSQDQSLSALQKKMEEYLEMGAQLGWLIDPQSKKTHMYSADGTVKTFGFEEVLQGDPLLPGFQIRMADLIDNH
jgi:Uma2 family endonuclease